MIPFLSPHNADKRSLLSTCPPVGVRLRRLRVRVTTFMFMVLHFLPFLAVCGADESTSGRAGHAGRCGLQVSAHRGEETLLLPGGQTVLCHQTAHQLPLQGDRVTYSMLASPVRTVDIYTCFSFTEESEVTDII